MRRFASIAVALAVLTARAAAQQSGLLLGLASDSGYRTLWIAPVEGVLTIAAKQPALIVPRADGFHHLAVVRWCSVDLTSGIPEGPFYDGADMLVDLPVGGPPVRPDSAHVDCVVADSIVTAIQDSLQRVAQRRLASAKTARDSTEAERNPPESYQCYSRELRITHAGPHYVSVFSHEGAGENCQAGRETWSAQRSTTRDGAEADLMALLSKAEGTRLTAKWEKEKGECALQHSPAESWGIERARGRWDFAFATSGATACAGRSGNEEEGFNIHQAVPAAIARRDPTNAWLPAAKQRFANVDDMFVAPTKDVVVVRIGSRLAAFTPNNGALGPIRFEVALRPGEAVVMTEWATGTNVNRWTRQLSELRESW